MNIYYTITVYKPVHIQEESFLDSNVITLCRMIMETQVIQMHWAYTDGMKWALKALSLGLHSAF